MSVEIIANDKHGAFFCNTTDHAFGPIVSSWIVEETEHCATIEEWMIEFLEWLPMDARRYSDADLEHQLCRFRDWLKTQAPCSECGNLTMLDVDARGEEICEECEEERLRKAHRKYNITQKLGLNKNG